jgi:hypothetical protein
MTTSSTFIFTLLSNIFVAVSEYINFITIDTQIVRLKKFFQNSLMKLEKEATELESKKAS